MDGFVVICITMIDSLRQFGVVNPYQSDKIKRKISATCKERYGVSWYCMMTSKFAETAISKHNKWFCQMLYDALGVQFNYEFDKLSYVSYDLYHDKLLIELNPAFSHNSAFSYAYKVGISANNWQRPQNSHYDKTMLAINNGYRCITVFDWHSADDIIQLISDILSNNERHKCDNIIELDLCTEDLSWYLNNGYKLQHTRIDCHYVNLRTRDTVMQLDDIVDIEQQYYVPVYDCGHVTLTRQ